MEKAKLRERIRVWFEYLNLARQSPREDIQAALKQSEKLYKTWGDTTVPFDVWWEKHSWLFADDIVSVRGPDETGPDDLVGIPCPSIEDLFLFIPLTRPLTQILKDISILIRKQRRLIGANDDYLALRPRLTKGAQPRIDILADELIVYRDVFLKTGLKGEKLLIQIHTFYDKKGQRRPRTLNGKASSSQRGLNRCIENAKRVMMHVARGEFPGPRTKKKEADRL
jgi:hypothetical protein